MTGPRISKSLLTLFLDLGRALFPLARDEERGQPVPKKEQGKRPLYKQWRTRTYGLDDLLRFVTEGHNLGWRLGPRDLVVDVDPRNGGTTSWAALLGVLGIEDPSDYAPTVATGGGGFHYYFRIPEGEGRLRKTLDQYPGIDFIREGGFVVIPGSYHYGTGELYSVDGSSPFDLPPPTFPRLDLLRYQGTDPSGAVEPGVPDMTPAQLTAALAALPVESYDSNDKWFEILAASHYATAGLGLDEFLDWSLSDPRFVDHETIIRTRWTSLGRRPEARPVTTATLLRHVGLHGGEIPGRLTASSDFAEFLDPSTTSRPVDSLRARISLLDPTSSSKQVVDVLREGVRTSPVQTDILIREIQTRTGISRGALVKQLGELRALNKGAVAESDADLRDLVQQVTAILLRDKYENGRRLQFCDDGRFWYYDGRKWIPYFEGLLDRDIYNAILTIRTESPEVDFDAARIMGPVAKILRAKTASESRIYDPIHGRPPVINLADCELWINPVDGSVRKKAHSPESNLTYCLDIPLDTSATCPLFDETLAGIFRDERDRENVIRHLWEIIGYLLQPNKNIPVWFLFLGSGANGKSVILKVISALLGDAVLEQSIAEFGPTRQFARANLLGKLLVVDDDVSAKTTLPDEFMKKLSENKHIVADVKFGPSIRFRSTASILLAANSIPGTRDFSHGMMRRASLIPFRRRFLPEEMDLDRADKIIATELPGILVEALRGLKRLRKRGNFLTPRTCLDLREAWKEESNPLFGFVADVLDVGPHYSTPLDTLWNLYRYWCADNGIDRYSVSRRALGRYLGEMGFRRKRGTNGKIQLVGVRPRPEMEADE